MTTQIGTKTPTRAHQALAAAACEKANIEHYRLEHTKVQLARIIANFNEFAFTLCVAWTQSGKSGVMCALMHALPRMLKAKKVFVVFVTNKSLTDLHEQNNETLRKFGFEETVEDWRIRTNKAKNVVTAHLMLSGGATERLADAEVIAEELGCDKIVFILDETHIAVGNESQLHKHARELVDNALQFHSPVIGFTATPDIFLSSETEVTAPVTIVPINPGEKYVGIRQLLEERISTFEYTFADLAAKVPKGDGFTIFRVGTKSAADDIEVIRRLSRTRKAAVRIFESKPSGEAQPISEFLPTLRNKPKYPVFIIIKDAAGAGIDFTRLGAEPVDLRRYILAAFDGRYGSAAAAAQSVGRWTGYSTKDSPMNEFPIYVAEKTMDALENHVMSMEAIFDGDMETAKKFIQKKGGKHINRDLHFDKDSIKFGSFEEYKNNLCDLAKERGAGRTKMTYSRADSLLRDQMPSKSTNFTDLSFDPENLEAAERSAKIRAHYGVPDDADGFWFTEFTFKVRKTKARAVQ